MSGHLKRVVDRYRAHNDVLERQLRSRALIRYASQELSTDELNEALREWQESMGQVRRGLRAACGLVDE